MQFHDQLFIFRRVLKRVQLLADDRHVLAGLFHSFLRRTAFQIKIELSESASVRFDLFAERMEPLYLFLIGHFRSLSFL